MTEPVTSGAAPLFQRRLPGLLALWLILGVALVLRVWGLNFGLPYLYQADEPNKIQIAQNIIKTGDLNPHYFRKPTLLIYANALLYIPYYFIGKAQGRFTTTADIPAVQRTNMGVAYIAAPDAVLMGRGLTVVVGVLGVWLTWALSLRITRHEGVALLAALLMALSPVNVAQSHLIETNAFLIVALLGVLWAALRVLDSGSRRDYLLAGFLTGVAVSCKYPGAVGFIMPLTAHWLRFNRTVPRDRNLIACALAVPVGFLLFTPFALLDPIAFVSGAGHEAIHYSTGHDGMEGWAPFWYVWYSITREGVFTLLGVGGAILAWRRRHQGLMLVTAFAGVYFVFISLFRVRNSRTFLPATPFLFLLGAWLLWYLVGEARKMPSASRRLAAQAGLVALLLAGIAAPTRASLAEIRLLTVVNSKETARVWIQEHLPAGSRVAIEAYAPWVDPQRYRLEAVRSMTRHPLQWYVDQRIDYLVFSQEMYGRFYLDPTRYPAEVAQYDAMFARFTLLKQFNDGDLEVRVYGVTP